MTSPDPDDFDDWPPDPGWSAPYDDPDPADYEHFEPMLDVPAGLVGTAIELLDLCNEVFNHPDSQTLDATIAAVIGRYQCADLTTLRWFHDGLAITAGRLNELLEDEGIVIEPEVNGRQHSQLYHP